MTTIVKSQAGFWRWAVVSVLTLAIVAAVFAGLAGAAAAGAEPQRVEVNVKTAFLAYLDGNREQRDVEEGDRFTVLRRAGSYYVVQDGARQALITIASVVPVKTPVPASKWNFVVAKADAPISIRSGRRGTPAKVQQGQVFEVLGRHPLGGTLYILMDNGRTAEISTDLVRAAREGEQPPPLVPGPLSGPIRLGCPIAIDRQGNVFVDSVPPGTLGERIGLQPGMRILKVNGEEIRTAADYDRASTLLGGGLRLLVQRRGLDYPELLVFRDPRNPRR
jgi:hypothetical protein